MGSLTVQAGRSTAIDVVAPGASYPESIAIARAVGRAWSEVHGPGATEIPVSAVATVAMLVRSRGQEDATAKKLLTFDHASFAMLAQVAWAIFANRRPDLIERAWPLIGVWQGQPSISDETQRAAKLAADAAVRAGWLVLVSARHRWDEDPLRAVLEHLRSRTDVGECDGGDHADPLGEACLAVSAVLSESGDRRT